MDQDLLGDAGVGDSDGGGVLFEGGGLEFRHLKNSTCFRSGSTVHVSEQPLCARHRQTLVFKLLFLCGAMAFRIAAFDATIFTCCVSLIERQHLSHEKHQNSVEQRQTLI